MHRGDFFGVSHGAAASSRASAARPHDTRPTARRRLGDNLLAILRVFPSPLPFPSRDVSSPLPYTLFLGRFSPPSVFFFKSLLTIYGGEQAAIAQVPRKTERRSRIPSFFPSAPRYGTSYRGSPAISCCVYRLSKFVRVEWAQKKIGCGYVCGPGAWVLPWTRKPTCSMSPSSRTTRKRYRSYLDALSLNLVCSHWRLLPPCRI